MRYGAASSFRPEDPVRARLLAAALALAACSDTFISISTDGRIEVAVNTEGSHPDTDGFTITVDGTRTHTIAAGQSITLTRLAEGAHSVLLAGLAANCHVDGSNPRDVSVGPDGAASVAFAVVCS
jgi:hypothetical protein